MKFYYLDGHLPVRILGEELDSFIIENLTKL